MLPRIIYYYIMFILYFPEVFNNNYSNSNSKYYINTDKQNTINGRIHQSKRLIHISYFKFVTKFAY